MSQWTTVIGYGSLMSAYGLGRDGDLVLHRPRRVELSNAWRGFAKQSLHADRLAAVVDRRDRSRPITARAVAAEEMGRSPQALAFDVDATGLPLLSRREGYSTDAMQRLVELSEGDVAGKLRRLSRSASGRSADYRRSLYDTLGYTSAHYIPHPLRLDGEDAIIFVAPAAEGSGCDKVVPVRVATDRCEALSASETWRIKNNDAQLDYFAMCLLGAAHGIDVADLCTDLSADLRRRLAAYEEHFAAEPETLRDLFEMSAAQYSTFRGPAVKRPPWR